MLSFRSNFNQITCTNRTPFVAANSRGCLSAVEAYIWDTAKTTPHPHARIRNLQ